jgi:uncharacterized protein YciI
MAYAVLAFDGTDAEAADRRAAALEGHVAFITAEAEAGRLALGLPLRDEDGRTLGSLMFLDVPDRAGVDRYLAGEPFAARGVWREVQVLDFRIAPLPYAPWPAPGGPAPASRTHTVTIARDGHDPEAPSRRLAARPRHFERVRSAAESGLLVLGGAMLDGPEGAMTGSIAVTRHASRAEVEAYWAEDPYVRDGVWKDLEYFGTAIRPLAYKPLPR